jgi:hypothetical protein
MKKRKAARPCHPTFKDLKFSQQPNCIKYSWCSAVSFSDDRGRPTHQNAGKSFPTYMADSLRKQ